MEINGGLVHDVVAIKQVVGSDFGEAPVIEIVGAPAKVQLKQDQLRDAIERYYRKQIGPQGRQIHFFVASKGVVMKNNVIGNETAEEIELTDSGTAGGW